MLTVLPSKNLPIRPSFFGAYPGSSFTVPVSLVVSGTSTFDQVPNLNFTMPVGGPDPLQQWFTITSTTGSNLGWSVPTETVTPAGGNWLQVSAPYGCCGTPQLIAVSVNAQTLPAGTYTAEILFGTNNTTWMTVPVTLTVVAKPAGGPFFGPFVTELGFVFGGGNTPAPLPQTVQITNAGTGTLNWTVAVSTFGGGNWLNVSSQSGTAPSILTVSVSTQGLQSGIYTGQLLFQAPGSSFTVPVSLVVSGTSIFDQVPGLNFTMPVGGPDPLQQKFSLTSTTGSNLGYSATSETVTGGNWPQVDAGCGGCGTPQAVTVSVDATTLTAGTYTGEILFGTNNTTWMTVPVTLTVGTPPQNVPPSPGPPNPARGTGANQTFVFTFSDPQGWQELDVVNILINNFLDGRNACYLAYSRSAGVLYLVNDPGTALLGLALNGTGGVGNSQCAVIGVGSSASGTGNTLTLTLDMTFTTAFAGNKVIYLAARDLLGGNSGWEPLGTWDAPGPASSGPSVTGVTPATSGAASQTYIFTFTDTNGWQDIAVANVLINSAIDGRHACFLAFVPTSASAGSVFLVDDAGDGAGPYSGVVVPGPGSASNSQCSIAGAGSSVNSTGNTLILTLAIAFTQSFSGNQIVYAAARSLTLSSGWQAVGTATVP